MTPGDHVRLHIEPGHRDALDLPIGIGEVRSVEQERGRKAVLIAFGDVLVYLWPVDETEIEVLAEPRRGRTA